MIYQADSWNKAYTSLIHSCK